MKNWGGIEAINGEISDLEAKIPNIFVVNVIITKNIELWTYSVDKTYAECLEAHNNGATLVLRFPNGRTMTMERYNPTVSNYTGYFLWSGIGTVENIFAIDDDQYSTAKLESNEVFTYTPVANINDVASTDYVNSQISTNLKKYLPLAGGDITGSLTVSKSFTIDGAYFKTGYNNGVYSSITESTGNGVVSFSNEGWGASVQTDSYVGVRGYAKSAQKTQGVDLECLDGSPIVRVRGKDNLSFVTTDSETATSVELMNVSTPTQDKSVANKQYVDTSISTLESKIPTNAATQDYVDTKVADYLPLSGGTLTGNLTVGGGVPLAINQKNYSATVGDITRPASILGYFPGNITAQGKGLGIAIGYPVSSGQTDVSGPILIQARKIGLDGDTYMNNHRIYDLLTPSSDTDAANKKYVDDNAGAKLTTRELNKIAYNLAADEERYIISNLSSSLQFDVGKLVNIFAQVLTKLVFVAVTPIVVGDKVIKISVYMKNLTSSSVTASVTYKAVLSE